MSYTNDGLNTAQQTTALYYEEKDFDGVPHVRHSPGSAWCRKYPELKRLRGGLKRVNGHPIDNLLEAVAHRLGIKTIKQIEMVVGLEPATISRIRAGVANLSPEKILNIYDAAARNGTPMSIEEIRTIAGCSITQYKGKK